MNNKEWHESFLGFMNQEKIDTMMANIDFYQELQSKDCLDEESYFKVSSLYEETENILDFIDDKIGEIYSNLKSNLGCISYLKEFEDYIRYFHLGNTFDLVNLLLQDIIVRHKDV